ncbi:hypothetical protein OIV83_003293 [Microbotryomycetes sp. JL201]|nr:hypothetical protein OIV83_003293 [Microbotryomycetes sp. JL201]
MSLAVASRGSNPTTNAPPTSSLMQLSSSSKQQQLAQPPTSSSTEAAQPGQDDVYVPLERAAQVITERLQRDEQAIGVADRLGFGASYDYVTPPNNAWVPYQKRRVISLPDKLFDEYNARAHCTMGLLPSIDRAWVTIDNRLLLWDWSDGSSFSIFEELSDVIIGVGLVKPRPDVFVDSVTHVLVLTTVSHVTLVGIGYAETSPGAKKQVTFYLTGLSVSSDGLPFTVIRGSANGRIFLCTSPDAVVPGGREGDGCLYEMAYRSNEGWFSKRCTLTNLTLNAITQSVVPSFLRSLSAINPRDHIVSIEIDNERGLVYALLRNGAIEMYELASSSPKSTFDGPPNKVARTGDVLRAAREMCKSPAIDASGFRIVSMHTIGTIEGERDKVGLVAVTNTGVRLYFTHQRRYPSYGSYSARSLELFHVRPPPVPQAPQQPASQQIGFYGQQPQPNSHSQPSQQQQSSEFAFKAVAQAVFGQQGLFLAANNKSEDVGALFMASPDNAAAGQQQSNGNSSSVGQRLSEIASTIEIGGQTWAIAEITPSSIVRVDGKMALNELATQVSQPRREWVVLTDSGANVLVRQRPVDTLVDVLEGASLGSSGAHGDMGIFFNTYVTLLLFQRPETEGVFIGLRYGLNQSCAMLLIIAAGNSRLALAEPPAITNGYAPTAKTPFSVAEHAKSLFFEHGGRPVSVDRGGYGTQPSSQAESIIFSGRHEGFAFYLARLLRPIWTAKVTQPAPTPTDKTRQTANVSEAVLTAVQRDLISLRTFVEQYVLRSLYPCWLADHLNLGPPVIRESQLFALSADASRAPHASVAYETEHASLVALRHLLVQSVEAISFVLLLIDYQLPDIVAMCDADTQKRLLDLTFKDLLTKKQGRDIARSLISAVINQQIGRQMSVDAISETLQQRCGSFCSADDVLLYKAIESLRRAKDASDSSERTESLRESLRLFTKAARHLSFDRMKEVCTEYNALRYPLGTIDLAVACAQEWDMSDKALSFWLEGRPANDQRAPVFELRSKCYETVFESLQKMDDLLNEAANSTAPDAPSCNLRTNAYNKALSVRDELFHSQLYDWYLSRGMTDQLLEARTPYIESYLSREPTTLEKSDLLWQYFVRMSRYGNAAVVLAHLAETLAFPLSVFKRVEYLSLAVGNAKSQLPSSHAGDSVQFLIDLEEKLEVAQVQVEIYRAIQDSDMDQDERSRWLDRVEDRLYTITELYTEFAEPLELLEIILLIFHVSDHRDEFLVSATWEAIVARVQEQNPDSVIDVSYGKIVDLGRRFHSSDVAFPLLFLLNLFEKLSYETAKGERPGWVPTAMRDAGVPEDILFAAFDELLTAKMPPWHTPAGLVALATDATTMLEQWLSNTSTSTLSTSVANGRMLSSFPATEVDTAVGKWLMSLNSTKGAGNVVARLQEVQRNVRRRY